MVEATGADERNSRWVGKTVEVVGCRTVVVGAEQMLEPIKKNWGAANTNNYRQAQTKPKTWSEQPNDKRRLSHDTTRHDTTQHGTAQHSTARHDTTEAVGAEQCTTELCFCCAPDTPTDTNELGTVCKTKRASEWQDIVGRKDGMKPKRDQTQFHSHR